MRLTGVVAGRWERQVGKRTFIFQWAERFIIPRDLLAARARMQCQDSWTSLVSLPFRSRASHFFSLRRSECSPVIARQSHAAYCLHGGLDGCCFVYEYINSVRLFLFEMAGDCSYLARDSVWGCFSLARLLLPGTSCFVPFPTERTPYGNKLNWLAETKAIQPSPS